MKKINDIVIYGAGGFGKEIARVIEKINSIESTWNILGFIDDGISEGTSILNYHLIGNVEYLNCYQKRLNVVVANGNREYLKKIILSINNSNLLFPNIIDPDARVDSNIIIGKGNIITYHGFISCDVKIGDFNIFNTRSSIGHDVSIGSFNIFNPNIQISGSVIIGDGNFFGLNSSVIQNKKIGNHNVIGAHSLVLNNIGNDSTFYGIPATKQ